MKHQYYADEKDLYKYAVLRILAIHYKSIGIHWMLTQNDDTKQGNRIEWMVDPTYLVGDEALRAAMRRRIFPEYVDEHNPGNPIDQNEKRVDWFLQDGLLPNAVEFKEFMEIGQERKNQHKRAKEMFSTSDLLFFDPDIGIEVGDMADRRNYLMLHELQDYSDKDALIFQYIAPQGGFTGRLSRICTLSRNLCKGYRNIFVLEIPKIVTFLYICNGSWSAKIIDLLSQNLYRWHGQFKFGALNREMANQPLHRIAHRSRSR